MAYSKVFIMAAFCLGVSLAAPQNFIRLVPAGGLRAVPADTVESHLVHTVQEEAPVITRLVPGGAFTQIIPSETRVVQSAPIVSAAPVVTRVVPAAPAILPAAPVAQVVQAAPVRAIVGERFVETETVDPNPQYNFGYAVSDSISGDNKAREEKRDGDLVTGSYTVADPDGRIRKVTYTADSVNGFQAQVTYDGQDGPVAIPFDAPVKAVAPTFVQNNEPVTIVSARQPALIQSTPTLVRTEALPQIVSQPTLVRNFGPGQQIIQIDDSNQAFQFTPFGIRSLPLGSRLANGSPIVVRAN